jgi:conjugative transposon TraK protein
MKIYDERQFIGLKNIDNALKMNRRVTTLVIISLPITVLIFVVALFTLHLNSKDTLYVLTQDGINEIKKSRVRENRELEAKKHIVLFYERALDLDPSREAINKSIEELFHLGGDDLKKYIEYYKESGFYNTLIGNNIMCRHELNEENIRVNTDDYPFEVTAYGKQILIRKTNRVEKSYVIKCKLYNTKDRTSKNPHAFWISDLMILENKNIE